VTAKDNVAPQNAVALSVMKNVPASAKSVQVWGGARGAHGTVLSFGTVGTRSAIGNAIIVKTALSIAERAGFQSPSLSVTSVGDNESKKRFTRELGNFFKKHLESIPQQFKSKALSDPDPVYRELAAKKDPVVERAPRSIDYLSESSRKVMMDTLALFESVGIPYTIDARLEHEPNTHAELVFGIDALQKDGSKTRVAVGGRYDENAKKMFGVQGDAPTAISLLLPKIVDLESVDEAPSCFVVHVGDAAKLKAFVLLDALWKAHIAVTQILMADNFKDQIERGKLSGAKYLAIIGQREALDNTVIVRNMTTQMQTTVPADKLEGTLARAHR
jgi:histidyl-tRNA synthetase